MTQPHKKAAPAAAAAVKQAARTSAENVVKFGGIAMKDLLATGSDEAQKAHEKIIELGREGAAKIAKGADAVTKALYEAVALSRDNVETAIECGHMNSALAKDISSEVIEYTNKAFSDNVELSKEFFACRTLNDMLELQSKAVKNTLDSFFGRTAKLSNLVFEYSTEALEPINERVSEVTAKVNKVLSDA